MEPLRLIETTPGNWSLLLTAGTAPAAEEAVMAAGHEPNGYFWEGVAQRVVAEQASGLAERLRYDPEGDMFVAYGTDRDALADLGTRMAVVAGDAAALTALIARAEADGFEFDD
ncbi:Imm51 family immunity protein [Nocardioides sp. WV_118_6]